MRRYTILLALRPSDAADATLPGHEFLMIRNAKRGGRLELPGGAIEDDETPQEGARRELIEETGHDWEQHHLVQERRSDLGIGYVFVCRLGPRVGDPEPNTLGLVFTARLPPPAELSFPDDPYPQLFAAAATHLASEKAFAARP